MSDLVRLDDVRDIPDMSITEADVYGPNGERLTGDYEDTWKPINLAELEDKPPVQPTLGGIGLVYPGERHVFSGPPESAKTLAAYAIGLEVIRAGGAIVVIDFEMGRWQARDRLLDLGATPDELARIYYVDPAEPATEQHIERLVQAGPQLVIVDAAAGAYDNLGLDDNKRQDVERFTRIYVTAFWRAGIATIVLDHVVKNTEARGTFMIGSERKLGGSQVHLGFTTISPISRGTSGLYKITTHKDRGGYLQRGHCANLQLESDADTHRITWAFTAAEHHAPDDDEFRPTKLMEKVSRWLEDEGGTHSGNRIEKAVEGKNDYIRQALKVLVREGFAARNETGRGYEYAHIRGYREADDLAPDNPSIHAGSDFAPTSPHLAPGAVMATSPLAPASIERGEGRGRREIDVYDPDVQHLLDDDIPL